MRPALRDCRDGFAAVALYFAACALVGDAHPATFEETKMTKPSPIQATAAPDPFGAEVAITWHHHEERPKDKEMAIIAIRPLGRGPQPSFMLLELYEFDAPEARWLSARTRLPIRHKTCYWASIDTLLLSVP